MKQIPPQTVLQGRYLVGDLIGKGGMGEVYLATDKRLGNYVALKRTFFTDDELLSGAFEREAKMLANLRHNVLPKVIDHFNEDDEQFLVMEYIGGEDLSKRLKATDKPFPVNWVLFWADELLDALAYIHSHNPPIIHRDIKPQNLKLTKDNHIILLDFGLAKNTTGKTRVSTAASLVGYTPHYAPIEQIRGTGTNARSDLFSLAATLYHLLANAPPIEALSRADAILGGKSDPLKPLNEINPDVSPLISSVIIKGMSLNQEQRFASAREMQKALRDAYTQIQQLANAQTVAFNLDEQKNNQVTEQIAVPLDVQALKTEEFPSLPQNIEKTAVMEANEAPKVDFDATIPMADFPDISTSSEKTELLPDVMRQGGDLERITAANAKFEEKTEIYNSIPKQEEKTEVFDSVPKQEEKTEVFADTNQPSEVDFAQTMPVISLDENVANQTPATPFDETDSFQIIEPTPENHDSYTSQPQGFVGNEVVQPTKQKSSNGKYIGILVGLFAVGLFAVGGILGGVYYYQNYMNVAKPTPSPEVKKTPEPTPQTTSTPIADNTNSSNENGNSAKPSPTTTPKTDNTPTKVDTTPTPTVEKTVQPTPQPTVAKTPINQPTPKPLATSKPLSTPKPATPKPTVKPGGRKDDIEQ